MSEIAPPTRAPGLGFGLFCVSAAILCLEVLHVRILSVQMWYHHAYMVVTMAMLGFAAAGSAVTVFPDLLRRPTQLSWWSLLFGISTVASHILMGSTIDSVTSMSAEGDSVGVALTCSMLLLPYFCGGLVIAIALSTARGVHSLYSANLIGSALGAWIFVVAITPLGAENLLLSCAIVGPLAALLFAGKGAGLVRGLSVVAALAIASLWFIDLDAMKVRLGAAKRATFNETVQVEERWTPLSRLDLYKDDVENPDRYFILQDGMAGTYLFREGTVQPRSLYDARSLTYLPHVRRALAGDGPAALVIGIGGGDDINQAFHYRAKSVLGIEINPEMVQLTGTDYAEFIGDPFHREGVEIVVGEGRSTLRRLDSKFDVIQIAGADTYTAGASGAFVLSESYLYTMEALSDYFDHLTDRGTLGIARFWDEPNKEALRMFGMGLLELRRRGIEQPSRHAAVMRSSWLGGPLFSMQPLDDETLERLYSRETDQGFEAEFELLWAPGEFADRHDTPFTQLAQAIDAGTEEEFYENYLLDVRPTYDDSPFFYNYEPQVPEEELPPSRFAEVSGFEFPRAPVILNTLLLQVSIAVLLLVLLPLLIVRAKGLRSDGAGLGLLYFAALGVGFMFLEISTIQRMVLFLGHPTYSLTVVLFSFLFFAGLGSRWAGRVAERRPGLMRGTLILITLLAIAIAAGLDTVLRAALSLDFPWRVALAVLLLAPVSFALGIPFPTALSRLERQAPALVPWAVGVNGGAGVIGSIAAVVLAMDHGFWVVCCAAACCYALAALAAGAFRPTTAD